MFVYWCKGGVKSISPPAAAKHFLDGGIFFLILRSKIKKKIPASKYNLARSTVKTLFTQLQTFYTAQNYLLRDTFFSDFAERNQKKMCLSKKIFRTRDNSQQGVDLWKKTNDTVRYGNFKHDRHHFCRSRRVGTTDQYQVSLYRKRIPRQLCY